MFIMKKKAEKIILQFGGNEYELSGGGGTPAANSVGTEQIEDGSIKTEDLADEVKEGLDELNNVTITDEELEECFYPRGNSGDDDADNDNDSDGDDNA